MGTSNTGRILIWDARAPCIEDRMDDILAAAPGYTIETCDSSEDLESRIEGAEVVATLELSAEAVARANDLRWMHTWSAGVDNIVPPGLEKTEAVYHVRQGQRRRDDGRVGDDADAHVEQAGHPLPCRA